jgi:hypothetical protein
MYVRIKRISTRSAFVLAMALYGTIGLLIGGILAGISLLDVPPGSEANILTRLGVWSAVVFPIAYGLIGGVTAAVAAALYNATAALVGGLKVEVPDLKPVWPAHNEGKERDA